jgi:hypothetical protein
VFGVPSIVANGDPFCGHDHRPDISEMLQA